MPGSRVAVPAKPHVVQVERAIVQVRWLAMVIVAIAAPFAGLTPAALLGTYAVVAVGVGYTLFLQFGVIDPQPPWLAGGYLACLMEVTLVSCIAVATGVADSTMFLAYFLILVAAALRYGFRAALVVTALCMASYGALAIVDPTERALALSELLLRFGFLAMTGMLAGFLAQEAHQNRVALARELERTDHQLMQSAKLAAIGELVASVAHEINNPLTAVLSNAELLTGEYGADDARSGELQTILVEALRARGIARTLLDFARQTPPKLELAEPGAIVQSVIPLVQKRAAVANVEIRHTHEADPLPIMVDVSQMKQVFINLLTNAIDAMPSGGSVGVTERRRHDCVEVVVSDTGVGIPSEHRDRIFDPFFTTKPGVSGTGLGLSVSYGIVERHGGTMSADSMLGAGTTFIVSLPLAPDGALAGGAVRQLQEVDS